MKIIFMGTPDFAVPALAALQEAGHAICAVYTQPPRKSGRGHKVFPTAVQLYAQQHNLPIRHPEKLKNNSDELAFFTSLGADIAVVAAYGLILPIAYLQAPTSGCVNIHASLLPRWRGASPIQSAILAGDAYSGITLMQMDQGLDTGAILLQDKVSIPPTMTAQHLHDELANMGGRLIVKFVQDPSAFPPTPQNDTQSTYAPLLQKENGQINWYQPAPCIIRQILAFTPWPGTFTTVDGVLFKIGAARIAPSTAAPSTSSPPGTVLDPTTLLILCGEDTALHIEKLQKPGGKMLDAASFLRGHSFSSHHRFGT